MSENPICLINTPSTFLADERVIPSLGLVKVASSLEVQNIPVDVLDLAGIENYTQVVRNYMHNTDVNIYGLTATTPQIPAAAKIVKEIRATNPDAKVILGGPHATMVYTAYFLEAAQANLSRQIQGLKPLPEDELELKGRGAKAYQQLLDMFDVTVVGDGEKAVFEAIKPNGPKLIDAGNMKSPYYLKRGELEKYPYPARHLYEIQSYNFSIDGVPAHAVIGQLGCPFKCEFCGGRDSHAFRVARFRNPEHVVEEVRDVYQKYRRPGVMFYDDELNINNDKLTQLLEGLIKMQEQERVDMRFRGFVKAELFNQKQANLMHRAGFRVILSGVESGSDEMLKTMDKNTTRESNSAWVSFCHNAGLRAKALLSNGHPGERKETLLDTLEWATTNLSPDWDDVDITNITQYPGSPYFDKSTPHPTKEGVWTYTGKNGEVLFSEDVNFVEKADYYKGIPGNYTSHVWTEHLSKEELVHYRDWMESILRGHLNLPSIQTVLPTQYRLNGNSKLPSHILRSSPEYSNLSYTNS